MKINVETIPLGTLSVKKINLTNDLGMELECLNFGGAITKLTAPDRNGVFENIILAYKNLEDYLENPSFFGTVIGRTAGRIDKGQVTINDQTYPLTPTQGIHTLHGGKEGFHKKLWDVETFEAEDKVGVHFSYTSADMEEGYPGNLKVKFTYTLTNENAFEISYCATTDKDTVVNLTNHSYFNLSGSMKQNIAPQILQVSSNQVLELDHDNIPTGTVLDVKEHAIFDFNAPHAIGVHIEDAFMNPQRGYDHPWILTPNTSTCASLYDEISGRQMIVSTTEPALVLYTMNFADPYMLDNDTLASPRRAICFETQKPPIGHNESFKEYSLLKPGEKFHSTTEYKFTTK